MHSTLLETKIIKNEASSEPKLAFKYQSRTNGDVIYNTGDIIFHEKKDIPTWGGPGTVIGQYGQWILIKQRSTYVIVHPCNIQLKNIDKIISSDSPSSDKNMGLEILKEETNKHNTDLMWESFQNPNMLF